MFEGGQIVGYSYYQEMFSSRSLLEMTIYIYPSWSHLLDLVKFAQSCITQFNKKLLNLLKIMSCVTVVDETFHQS